MIFVSYSHYDKDWRRRFMRMAKPLQKYAQINLWSDADIKPNDTWPDSIQSALHEAKIAILLVSDFFLDSEFITDVELPFLLKERDAKRLSVFWVPLSPCLYKQTPLRKIQAVGDPSRPLNSLSEYEWKKVFCELCELIDNSVKSFEVPTINNLLAGRSLQTKTEKLQVLAKPAFRETQILVYSTDNAWHVQVPVAKGETTTTCWIGDEGSKAGTQFKIVALTTGGDTLKTASRFLNLPDHRTRSEEITVKRA